jgi:hypothetical protein
VLPCTTLIISPSYLGTNGLVLVKTYPLSGGERR